MTETKTTYTLPDANYTMPGAATSRECIAHHHACDCRERDFRAALAVAQDVMEAYAPSHVLEEWHCRVEDLTGTAYPAGVTAQERLRL